MPEAKNPFPENTTQIEMTEDGIPKVVNGRPLNEIEIQALREAKTRRAAIDAQADTPKEHGASGRKSEPTRYGDWETAGRAIDFS